jgi:hypothetical protein
LPNTRIAARAALDAHVVDTGGRDQGVVGGHQIGALDRIERLALHDRIAELRKDRDDLALIARKYLDDAVFVEVDISNRGPLRREGVIGDRRHRHGLQLTVRQLDLVVCRRRRLGRLGLVCGLAASEKGQAGESDERPGAYGAAAGRFLTESHVFVSPLTSGPAISQMRRRVYCD